jgi:hypothetical protein
MECNAFHRRFSWEFLIIQGFELIKLITSFEIVLFVCFQSALMADDTPLLKAILENHARTSDEFRDLSCRWMATTKIGGVQKKFQLDFWSKEGRFFRLDTIEYDESGELASEVTKLIIRPEGYAEIIGKRSDPFGAIVAFGSAAEGLDRMAGNNFFDSATRKGGISPISVAINGYLAGESEWKLKKVSQGDGQVSQEWVWSDGTTRTESEMVLEPVAHSCRKSSIQSFTNGARGLGIKVEKEYDANLVVPLRHHEIWTRSDGSIEEWIYSRENCSLESPSLEVFSLAMPGSGQTSAGVWTRRVMTLSVGVTLLGLYAWFRKRRKYAR